MKGIKKISILFAVLMLVSAFASCSEVKDFTKIKYAKEATQILTVTDGDTVVYSEERVYKDYVVTIKTKKLSDNMYEESFEESETTKSYDKVPYIDIYRKKNYKGGAFEENGNILKFNVAERRLKDLLGLDKSEVSGDVSVTAYSVDKSPKTLIIEYKTKTGKQVKIVTEYIFEDENTSSDTASDTTSEDTSGTESETNSETSSEAND